MRPLVLLSNDDGFAAPGIRALRDALLPSMDVIVMAPETEQSAQSHALSIHHPLRPREVEPGIFALDGTPADCVYVALYAGTRFVPRRPDLVLSGINLGLNLGQDVFYSGTVAAAREGALRRIPSVAVSAHGRADLARVASCAVSVAHAVLAGYAKRGVLMNLNVPQRWSGELRVCRLGSRVYDEVVDLRTDPRGREYLWLGGPGVTHQPDAGADTEAYDQGAASLTPLSLDMTDGAVLDACRTLVAGVDATAWSKEPEE